MTKIGHKTSLPELAALVSQALAGAGISATLSGGGAVSIYTENEYESFDLDFVTSRRIDALEDALTPLGFTRVRGQREFRHPDSEYYVEFPPGPLAFGETSVRDSEATTLATAFGPIRIITPTQSVMDRLSAFVHWHDNQSLDQALMIVRRQRVDWPVVYAWAKREGVDAAVVDRVRRFAHSD